VTVEERRFSAAYESGPLWGVIPKARVFASGPRDLPRNGLRYGRSLAPLKDGFARDDALRTAYAL
jgi:hypothetical protein